MAKFYRPPQVGNAELKRRGKSKRITPRHSNMWLVSLVSKSWDDIDYQQEEAGWSKAERALANPRKSEMETFQWSGGRLLEQLKREERIIMNTKIDKRKCLVSAPGRVLSIQKYGKGKVRRGIVFIEVPYNKRRRNQRSFVKALGPIAKALGNPRRTKRLRNSELVYRIDKLFA